MKHQTLAELRASADVSDALRMTKREKIERWAEALEARGGEKLKMLLGIEYSPPELLGRLREDNSPLTVAYEDPTLRAAGLTGDTYGEARAFFELNSFQMHRMLCGCHLGFHSPSDRMARRVRGIGDPFGGVARFVANCRQRFSPV